MSNDSTRSTDNSNRGRHTPSHRENNDNSSEGSCSKSTSSKKVELLSFDKDLDVEIELSAAVEKSDATHSNVVGKSIAQSDNSNGALNSDESDHSNAYNESHHSDHFDEGDHSHVKQVGRGSELDGTHTRRRSVSSSLSPSRRSSHSTDGHTSSPFDYVRAFLLATPGMFHLI